MEENPVKGDIWIPSACSLCMNTCSIIIKRQNGVVTKIEGNPNSPISAGTLCPRGAAGIMFLYDPYRVKAPLKRTNPEKGIGIDPGWEEISWDEALDIIAQRLKKIREEDPRKLMMAGTAASMIASMYTFLFMTAFGSPNGWFAGAGIHCGNGWHLTSNILYQSIGRNPDSDHCNYVILFGSNWGTAAGYGFNMQAKKVAEARLRGMRLVVVDPYLSGSAEKADEWIPIRPGTDAALALGMAHVLVHELGVYDKEYIKKFTNGPYLIGPEGYYVREPASGKPLIWDSGTGETKPYDAAGIKNFAIEGSYTAQGVACQPAFQVVKDHLRNYPPERASEITTVPADTIRRLAKEFGLAARIGSTITLGGKELPYRPAAAHAFKGANAHKHQLLIAMAIDLLNLLVGAQDVPGGMLGQSPRCDGYPETGRPHWIPTEGPDGLAVAGAWLLGAPHYPPHEVTQPQSLLLSEIMPLGLTSPLLPLTVLEPEKYGLDYSPEILINYGTNTLMSYANPEIMARWYKKIPFIVGVNLFLNESTDFFDIVLPDACYLERLDPMPNLPIPMHHTCSNLSDQWAFAIRQPAIAPRFQERSYIDILLDLAERAGCREEFNLIIGSYFGIEGDYRLDVEKRYNWEEIVDRAYKSNFGPGHGLEWFREHGVLTWPRKVEEAYWRPFIKARVPIYFEYFKKLGEEVKAITTKMGIEWDISDYQPVPDWKPCKSHELNLPQYDLYAFYYRVAWHTFSFTAENPWLDELSQQDPYTYLICLSSETARNKGIGDGELIWLESAESRRIKGIVRLTEGIHPEAVAIANCFGHWAPGLPIAKDKGVCINHLQPISHDYIDFTVGGLDLCHKVRLYKATDS
ncbi:MAG: hypothetical protein A3G93_13845 [Nitrospinae bacterium RIFCSPLOWO2_12_FULL_45_22]|nr:MAG: hypothetical protein A3G93_13845 [Nitrospinae bacterium RIFCSPLOWO2_12_FULL_45_22]